jgi:STIP1 family protein 1
MNSKADEFRVAGNGYFGSGQFSKAIECYSKAISMDPRNSLYFGNRSLCHLKLGKYGLAYNDAIKAVDIDSNNLKARYVMGMSLLEMKQGKESFIAFSKALELARIQSSPFYDEINAYYRKARHLKWEEEEKERVEEGVHILNYLKGLVERDCDDQIIRLGNRNQSLLEENNRRIKHSSHDTVDDDKGKGNDHEIPLDQDQLETEVQVIKTKSSGIIENMKTIFAAADDHYKVRNVPDYFLCKITFEIMRDPVITPNGITYERRAILEHFKKNGWIDPVARTPLHPKDLISNLALREGIEEFLAENEWAYDY